MPPGGSDLLLDQVVIVEQPLRRGCDSSPALERLGDRRIGLCEHVLVRRETGQEEVPLAAGGTDLVQTSQHPCVLFELTDAEELRPQRLLVRAPLPRRLSADGVAMKNRPPFCASRPDLNGSGWSQLRSERRRRPRQLDGEQAARSRQVTNANLAAARLNALQPEAEPSLIGAALLEWTEQLLGLARG